MDYLKFGSNNNNNTKIINPIDLTAIKENVQSDAYEYAEEYLADIEWIHHNCFVYFSGKKSISMILVRTKGVDDIPFDQMFLPIDFRKSQIHKGSHEASGILFERAEIHEKL